MSHTWKRTLLAIAALAALGAASGGAAEVGLSNGALVIVGGGIRPAIFDRFLELAGGPDAPIVVIPTAGGGEKYGPDWGGLERLRKAGAKNLTLRHTNDRAVADSAEFVEAIREAGGVWFTGGRQWRLADAYLDTRVHRELEHLLERGGVIGGSSAGATIQGSYLVRGDTETNTVMMGDHVRGLGFLKNSAIDQHLLRRNRQFDLVGVIRAHPNLLGIGIDEYTAIVVQGDEFEVIGQSYVAIYDAKKMIPPGGLFYFLAPGDKFNLKTRVAMRGRDKPRPIERVTERPWPSDRPPPVFTQPPVVEANPNPAVPLAAVVRFTADRAVTTTITVSGGEPRSELTYDESHRPEDGLPVVGLRPGRTHHIRVSIRDSKGNVTQAREALAFTTPGLPTDPTAFPPLQVNVSQPGRMEPGITILSVRRGRAGLRAQSAASARFGETYGLLLGLDAAGQVTWYYRTDARISDFDQLANGNIVYLTHDFRAVEIDLLGNVVAEWYAARRPQGAADSIPVDTLTFHHEIEELPNGNLLALGSELREIDNYYGSDTDPRAPRKRQRVMGDEIVEFTREGKVVWRWNAFEHLDPFFIGHGIMNNYWISRGFPETLDWTHGNGLFYDGRDDSILLNLRKLSAVLKIDHSTGDIDWIFSEPTGWPERFQGLLLKPSGEMDWPWYQHAPKLTAEGNILLFNNGIWRNRPFAKLIPTPESYARAAEYALDPDRRQVRQVWSSEGPGPGAVVGFAMGDADQLPVTGNILVCYGNSRLKSSYGKGGRPLPWPLVREFTHTDPAEVVWEVVLAHGEQRTPVTWMLFGSQRMDLAP